MPYFAMGGFFPVKENGIRTFEFRLVKPGGRDCVPYITRNCKDSLFNLARHHSHLYELRVIEDWKVSAHIQQASYAAETEGVRPILAEFEFDLPSEEGSLALSAIINETFWEI
jgi:hypothetical protein